MAALLFITSMTVLTLWYYSEATVKTWRFCTGRYMDGKRRSKADRDYASGLERWWLNLTNWRRAIYRLTPFIVFPLIIWLQMRHPMVLRAGGGTAIGCAGVIATRRLMRRFLSWQHTRRVVKPLRAALSETFDQSHGWALDVPVKYAKDRRAAVRVKYPEGWLGKSPVERKKLLEAVMCEHLVGDWDARWRTTDGERLLVLRQAPKPPSYVSFTQLLPHIEAAKDSEVVLGIGSHSKPVKVNLDTESPNILFSAGQGGGKSNCQALVASQVAYRGGRVVVLDIKRESHLWAPATWVHKDVADIHDTLIALAAELEARYRGGDKSQRILVIADEQNLQQRQLTRYWQRIRTAKDQKPSPAIEALEQILLTGRQARINVFASGQQMNAQASGGGAARENFSYRVLGRYSSNTAKMLAEGVALPKSSRHLGRVQVVADGEPKEVQLAHATTDGKPASVEFARFVKRCPDVPVSLHKETPREEVAVLVGDILGDRPDLKLVEPVRFTLREAASFGIVPLKYEALKKRRQRDHSFPEGSEDGWTREELTEWWDSAQVSA